jgi:pyruvate,water dikinase
METLGRQVTDAADPHELMDVITAAQRWSRELLGIHRWSLMAADLAVPLLGRLVGRWVSKERQAELSSRLLAGLPNKSVELDQALRRLAASADPEGEDLESFLVTYGHRSFNLDIYYPTFADEPEQVLRLLEVAGQGPDPVARAADREAAEDAVRAVIVAGPATIVARLATIVARPAGRLKWLAFEQVLGLARWYVRLREDQRFAWQRVLALMRRAFVRMGERWAADGVLAEGNDVFFATLKEIEELVRPTALQPDTHGEMRRTVMARRATFKRLRQEFELAPYLTYPAFLRGNRPLEVGAEPEAGRWQGVPVSPGLVRGMVRVVLSPGQFERIAPGDILVTRSTDPGWTPIFGRLGGLIMEQGGQLSHGSVVAREYGLPAVVGIPHISEQLRDGDVVLLDGMSGTVVIEITQLCKH